MKHRTVCVFHKVGGRCCWKCNGAHKKSLECHQKKFCFSAVLLRSGSAGSTENTFHHKAKFASKQVPLTAAFSLSRHLVKCFVVSRCLSISPDPVGEG